MNSHHGTQPLVSIIINNYNYGRFLEEAINSALNQTYPNLEVIVVDDGSSDNSREIINAFSPKITVIFKENGGQASAFNAGFKVSQGNIILFLDSDDILQPSVATSVVNSFKDSEVSKVHWPLWEINEFGQEMGEVFPKVALPEGCLLEDIIKRGPNGYISAPTSGNAWSRRFLDQVLPMPTDTFRISADSYLFMLAPLFGIVKLINEPQGFYRIHGKNNYKGKALQEETFSFLVSHYEQSCCILKKFLAQTGINVDTKDWKDTWVYNLLDSINDIKSLIAVNEAFILVDEDQWDAAGNVAGRKAIPFLEKNGQYWGRPENDQIAILEIERLKNKGASYIVFAWPAFWWLNYYLAMSDYLKTNYNCILANERLVIYKLFHASQE